MKEEGLPLADALRKVYDSKLFGQINDPETGLDREGPVFLYDMLCEEQQFALVSRTCTRGSPDPCPVGSVTFAPRVA